jgi:hypothetical protein
MFALKALYRIQYPDIIYPQLVPIDTSASEKLQSALRSIVPP